MARVLRDAAAKDKYNVLDNLLTEYGDTYTSNEINDALVRAAVNNSVDCLKRLLVHGADPNSTDHDGYTCLMLAAANGFAEVAEIMLDAKCDINAVSNTRRTALHMATWWNHPKLLRILLKHQIKCETDIQDEDGDTALMNAAKKGWDYPIRLLVRSNCNVNIRNIEQEKALHFAARQGHTKCAELLIKAGADKESKDMWGYTPILLAAHMRKLDTLKLFLKQGFDVEATDKSGRTTLHIASDKGFYEGVEQLLSFGANPNVMNNEGFCPLAEAVFHCHARTALRLLKAGAHANVTCKGIINRKIVWCSVIEVALVQKNLALTYMLRSCGANTKCSLLTTYYPEILCQSESVFEWYQEFANVPLRLGELSRLALRNVYGWKLPELIKELPMPKIVRKLVTFSDFDELLDVYEAENIRNLQEKLP